MKMIVYILAGLAGFFLYQNSGETPQIRIAIALGLLMACVPCWLIGFICAKAFANRVDIDGDYVDALSWTNLVLWIFPPFGMIAGTILYEWSNRSEMRSTKFKLISTVCVLASMANAAMGIKANVSDQLNHGVASQFERS